MKKEIPILYSTFMAQAKVAWRKTQTRRLVKPQLHPDGTEIVDSGKPWNKGKGRWHNRFKIGENPVRYQIASLHDCPYGEVGSILWGRESWNMCTKDQLAPGDQWMQRNDGIPKGEWVWVYKAGELYSNNPDHPEWGKKLWKPSIHMPKEAARIWDEITGIRVERVADISEEDCIAEGIEMLYNSKKEYCGFKNYLKEGEDKNTVGFGSPIKSYRSLWQLINGKPKLKGGQYEVYPFDEQAAAEFAGVTTWKGKPLTVITNPWVWVIESKQLSVNGKP